jgi:hypothetical protein
MKSKEILVCAFNLSILSYIYAAPVFYLLYRHTTLSNCYETEDSSY